MRGIFAGWLIALMVWLLPFAERARLWVIIILSYLICLGLRAAVLLSAAFVGSGLTARCGDALASPARLRTKARATNLMQF